jgi:hypothetical protein
VCVFTQQAAYQGGFASPVGANQGDTFAQGHLHVDSVQNLDAPEGFTDFIETNH